MVCADVRAMLDRPRYPQPARVVVEFHPLHADAEPHGPLLQFLWAYLVGWRIDGPERSREHEVTGRDDVREVPEVVRVLGKEPDLTW